MRDISLDEVAKVGAPKSKVRSSSNGLPTNYQSERPPRVLLRPRAGFYAMRLRGVHLGPGADLPALSDGAAAAKRGQWTEAGRVVPLTEVWRADRRPGGRRRLRGD